MRLAVGDDVLDDRRPHPLVVVPEGLGSVLKRSYDPQALPAVDALEHGSVELRDRQEGVGDLRGVAVEDPGTVTGSRRRCARPEPTGRKQCRACAEG